MTATKSLLLVALTGVAAVAHAMDATVAHQTLPGVSAEPIEAATGLRSPQDLEAFVDGILAVSLNANHIAGATIAVVKDGKLFFSKGYGYANVEGKIPVDAEQTLFRPGSVSKLFTWTAVMQLMEQGKLDLDADVNTYLTDFKIPATFAQPVTLRNILTHTAGFEDSNAGFLVARNADGLQPPAQFLPRHMPARVRAPTTDFNSATQASYSNWAAALAGLIVANVSGMTFDDYIEKNIFIPLGMTHSTFREPLPPNLEKLMSAGFRYQGGAFRPQGFEFIHNFAPAGSLSSSANDMAKFMLAHLGNGALGGALGGARILKEQTARQMHSRLLSPNPYLSGWCYGFYEIYANGRRVVAHNGGTPNFGTDLWLLPDEQVGLFVSYNTPSGDAPGELTRAFMDRYFPARVPSIKPPADFAARVASYAGAYRANRSAFTTFEKVIGLSGDIAVAAGPNNQLLVMQGAEPSRWIEVAPDVFRHVERDQTIAFARGADGAVTHLLGSGSSRRLAWFESARFHQWILGLGALGFLVAIVSALRHRIDDRIAPAQARWARRLAAALGLVNLAFLITLALVLSDSDRLYYEIPSALRVALIFPLIALPLTIAVAYCAVGVWRARVWSRYACIQYSLIAVLSVAFLWSLNFWNLVGYHFG